MGKYFLKLVTASRRILLPPTAWSASVLLLIVLAAPLAAAATAAPPPAPKDDFAQYLAEHQADLTPFFTSHVDEFAKLAVPPLMGLLSTIVLLTILLGWGLDVLLSRGFAAFFSPAFARFRESFIYATGRLVLSVVFTGLMAGIVLLTLSVPHGGYISAGVALVFILGALVAQVYWIGYIYRSNVPVSLLFYLTLAIVHDVAGGLIALPVMGAAAPAVATSFIDNIITPKMHGEVVSTRRDLAVAQAALDEVQNKTNDAQARLTQAQADQEKLRQQIIDKKNSDLYVFSQIVKVRAQGDLETARQQLTDFRTRFPSSPLDAAAGDQLSQVNAAMATAQTQKAQADADAAKAAALARADLLARLGRGEVSLSEMREAIVGRKRSEIKDLLGQPDETQSDRWSYRANMILNPVSNRKFGLTVYFFEGNVQTLDYFGNGVGP